MKKPARKKTPKPPAKKKIPNQDISTGYLDKVYELDKFVKLIPKVAKALQAFRKKHPFDAIAFTGCSGAAFAYPLSYKLKIPLICVRKKDSSHCTRPLEGYIGAKSYVIVDDFISSGDTIKKIISTIKTHAKVKNKVPKVVGIFLYDQDGWRKQFAGVPVIGVRL